MKNPIKVFTVGLLLFCVVARAGICVSPIERSHLFN